jgi:hypothetical protein
MKLPKDSVLDWDWDYPDYAILDYVDYISEPCSLHPNGTLTGTCRKDETLHISEGRVETWIKFPYAEFGSMKIGFRINAPVGTADIVTGYCVIIPVNPENTIQVLKLGTLFAMKNVTRAIPNPLDWNQVRVSFYKNTENIFQIDVEVFGEVNWEKMCDSILDPSPANETSEYQRISIGAELDQKWDDLKIYRRKVV